MERSYIFVVTRLLMWQRSLFCCMCENTTIVSHRVVSSRFRVRRNLAKVYKYFSRT